MMPVIEHLIRADVIRDPDPLTRPLRQAAVLSALREVDQTELTSATRVSIQRLIEELESIASAQYSIEGYLGGVGGTHGRRNPLREGGPGSVSPTGGVRGTATFGSLAMSSHVFFNQRLDDDPDYTGNKDKWLTHRITDAYLSAQFEFGELFIGSIDRNWGPTGITGSLVSAESYSYDHFMFQVGSDKIRVQSLLTDLDAFENPPDAEIQRWWITHRLMLRPADWIVIVAKQATLWAGGGRGLELRWLNPLKPSRSTALDEPTAGDSTNSVYGLDLWIHVPNRVTIQWDFTVDDFGFRFGSTVPDRLAGGMAVDVPLGPWASVRGTFSYASSLVYRTRRGNVDTMMRRGIGLGRNFSDYTETGVSLSLLPAQFVSVVPEVTLLRQGEGDFRLPFPAQPALDHPFIFEGIVENTWRAAVRAAITATTPFHISGHAGLHLIDNSGHVPGASRTVFVAGFRVEARLGRRGPL